MALVEWCYPIHLQVCSVAAARCPDCGVRVQLPYEYGHQPGLVDPASAATWLLEHAREDPHRHPHLLPALPRPAA
jgi:hypothetical protein